MNNPLASVSSLIQMMQSKENLDEKTQENLKLIQTQIQRITQVTKDMMDFARIRPAAKSLVDVNDLIENLCGWRALTNPFKSSRSRNISPKTCRRFSRTATNCSKFS